MGYGSVSLFGWSRRDKRMGIWVLGVWTGSKAPEWMDIKGKLTLGLWHGYHIHFVVYIVADCIRVSFPSLLKDSRTPENT